MAINNEIIKDILRHNDITNSEDILSINYETESGKGTFKVFMPDRFPTTAHNIKIFIDMFHKALDNGATARVLYDYLIKCREFLNNLRERTPDYTDDDKKTRAALAGHIKKYDSNIATLAKDFNFETIKTDAVKMQKVNLLVDRMENGRRKAVNKKGYRFIKAGHVFHVYKENRTCFVIVPCCGLAIANYEGNVNAAPEYINENVLHLMNNRVDRLVVAYNHFMEIIKESDNIVLNDDIKVPEVATPEETAPAPTEEKIETATPEAKEVETAETAAPEVVQDRDISNAVNIVDGNDKYTIIAAPHGRYDVIYNDLKTNFNISITINGNGKIERYYNGNRSYYTGKYFYNDGVKELYAIYEKLRDLQLLPAYAPSQTTRDNINAIYNRTTHQAPRLAYNSTVYYNIMEPYKTATPRRPTQGHTTPYKATISHNGITSHTRPHKAVIRSYNAPPLHYITAYINGIQGRYNTLPLARCPGATSKAATPRYYNTS